MLSYGSEDPERWAFLHNLGSGALIGALLHLTGDFFHRGVFTSIVLHA